MSDNLIAQLTEIRKVYGSPMGSDGFSVEYDEAIGAAIQVIAEREALRAENDTLRRLLLSVINAESGHDLYLARSAARAALKEGK